MENLRGGRYRVRVAETGADLAAAQSLRQRCFRAGRDGLDRDAFDDRCQHFLVEDQASGTLVGCFRVMHLRDGAEIGSSYSAQFYTLSGLATFEAPMAELGRFCIDPDTGGDPDILRLAWAALARFVAEREVAMLFGCSSFAGTDPMPYQDAFSLLKARYLAPARWLPGEKAAAISPFATGPLADAKQAIKSLPPLLRSYLAMGGWVSDHAVIDHDLGTLHVFTGLEIAAIPPARARALQSLVT